MRFLYLLFSFLFLLFSLFNMHHGLMRNCQVKENHPETKRTWLVLIPKTSRGQSCTRPKTLIHVYYFNISTRSKMISLATVCLTVLPQHTEGGGEPLPISGTFSYRGFPANSIDWFLIDERRQKWVRHVYRSKHVDDYAPHSYKSSGKVHNSSMYFAFCLVNLHQDKLTYTLEGERWRRLVAVAAGCSGCPGCCCSCRSCVCLCGLCCTEPCAVTAG